MTSVLPVSALYCSKACFSNSAGETLVLDEPAVPPPPPQQPPAVAAPPPQPPLPDAVLPATAPLVWTAY
ncbi:MAG: hypothetical protein C4550_07000 [Nitrospiraceae bacterium]|nr:MAG: hypothetical protein C4550_07000 [Nitrospiraceae bacterium]